MKMLVAGLGCVLALAACQPADPDVANVQASIRESAERQGLTVKQVALRKESNDRIVGEAIVARRGDPGVEVRWDCAADRAQGPRFRWHCARPGQAAGHSGGATPAPAPAASAVGREAFVGRWTETSDCSNVTLLGADGLFVTSNGGSGSWDVQGSQMMVSGPGGTMTLQVHLDDPNMMTLTAADGSQVVWTRC